ncbi:MAG: hypothetical protein ACXVBX_09430 [Flavisolibacter sp.]
MKNFFTLTLLSLAAIFTLSSCTKTDVISNETDVVGEWAVTGIRSNMANDWNGDGYSETDIYGSYTPCQRDIVLAFDQFGGGQGRQGCNSYWENLNWQLTNGNRTLRIDLTGDVIQLDNLRVSYNTIQGDDYVYSNGRNFIVTYTLERR